MSLKQSFNWLNWSKNYQSYMRDPKTQFIQKNFDKTAPLGKGRGYAGIGVGAAGLDIAFDTIYRMKQGDSLGSSFLKSLGEGALWAVAPTTMWTTQFIAPMAVGSVKAGMAFNDRLKTNYRNNTKVGTNFTYRDTRSAYTMRQAAVQAIQGSKMNARNALGGEAALMHRSYKTRVR